MNKQLLSSRHIANKLDIFPIGLGAMPLSILNRPLEKEALHVIETFLNAGGNFIDTANVYGLDDSDRGHNERLIQKALNQFGYSDKVLVATKGGATRPQGGWGLGEGHPTQLRQLCEKSLLDLGIDAHSLYYLHGPDPRVPFADSLGELINLKKAGKIKNIGIANVELDQVKQALELTEIAAVQNRCNPFCKGDFENGLIAFCKQNNIAYVPYCPLGGWGDHAKLSENILFTDLTKKYQVSSYVICLAWLLSKDTHIIPIPGMDKKEQIKTNFSAVSVFLNPDDIKKIDAFSNLYSPIHKEQ